ncbi:MAG: PcfB family protein [Eubacterium sp.]|nr:PcfB family protein [Eubacterium sp.]
MGSLSDEMMAKAISSDSAKAVQTALKTAQGAAKEALKVGEKAVKGICLLILDGSAFTTENVMKAVRYAAFKSSGDVKYSKNNIDIEVLQKSGKVKKIEENIVADVMKYFDEQCKKHGVKYSAMKDERNPDKPAYMVFFEGKNSDLIYSVLQESYKDYMHAQEQETTPDRKREKQNVTQKSKESVKAKLAFFGIGLQLGIENAMR